MSVRVALNPDALSSMATTGKSARTRGVLMEALRRGIEPYFGCDLCGYGKVIIANTDIFEDGYGMEACSECGTKHWVEFQVLPPDGWSTSSRPLKPTKLTLLMET